MMTVGIENCRFYAYHGVMAQEQRVGNDFIVSAQLSYPDSFSESGNDGNPQDDISDTISYADLYEIVAEEMQTPAKLLETLARRIASRAKEHWPQISKGKVRITKVTPPIKGIQGSTFVELSF